MTSGMIKTAQEMVVFESLGKLKFHAKFFFVDFFSKFFFRLKCAVRQAIAKHMENFTFYKSSFSPLNDEIKFCRTELSQNSGEAAEGFKSNNPNFSFVVVIDKIYLLSDFVFRLN